MLKKQQNKKIIVFNKGIKIKDISKVYACCKKTQRPVNERP